MQRFIELINKPVASKTIIQRLYEEEIPLYIWGCGEIGHIVNNYLCNNSIKISGFVTNDGNRNQVVNQYTFEELEEIGEKYNLIVGHSHYEKRDDIKERYLLIDKVFCFTSLCYSQFDTISYDFFIDNADNYFRTYNLLEDINSKACMIAYLNARINDDVGYIIKAFIKPQNYFNNDIFRVANDETYLDVGAFNGDTIRLFVEESKGMYKKIIAVEPDVKSFCELKQMISNNKYRNIDMYNCGAWNEDDNLYVCGDGQNVSVSESVNGHKLKFVCIDNLIDESDIITLIKINYLKGVKQTLEGAKRIIISCKPKLVISVGFDEKAIIEIPQMLSSIMPGYKFFLRYNGAMPARLTLYAIYK